MRRKRRKCFSFKKSLRLLIPLILIIIILVNANNILLFYQSKVTGYQVNTLDKFHKLDIYSVVKKYDYSETLEKIIFTSDYQTDYLNDYLDINYYDTDTFLRNINILLSLGYRSEEINLIYKSLSEESITFLTKNDYMSDMINILKLNYFVEDNLERYYKYSLNNDLSTTDLITYVNVGLDYDYYTNVINIDDPDNINVLVNKYHILSSSYVPSDLEAINQKYNRGANNKLRKEARENFEKMCISALNDGITIYSGSAYRSYNYQLNLYNRYVNKDGKNAADTYSARAGYSEHQTGLATDILNKNSDYIQASDKEYTWLVNNSYKYGFILRYPENKEKITGYVYEPWHYRYVGKDIAKDIYDGNITYDEYIARR